MRLTRSLLSLIVTAYQQIACLTKKTWRSDGGVVMVPRRGQTRRPAEANGQPAGAFAQGLILRGSRSIYVALSATRHWLMLAA